jgi:hypothetical protein
MPNHLLRKRLASWLICHTHKHIHVFLKVSKIFEELIITVDTQNVSLLLLNNVKPLEKIV